MPWIELALTEMREPGKLALDAPVAPPRVLTREPQNQLLHPAVDRRTPAAALAVGPAPRDELAMPAEHGLGADEQQRPPRTGQKSFERREQHAVVVAKLSSTDLALQHV
jgi:hypothetical protein